MILYNPNKNKVEFLCGGVRYYMNPKESKTFPDNVALHALERSKVGLVEYSPIYDREMTETDIEYVDMPWNKLKTLGSNRKLFKPGITRFDLEKALKDYDIAQGRTVQEPFNQEERKGA
jgi:O-methyltransferase involved in polyketide biosynthesis